MGLNNLALNVLRKQQVNYDLLYNLGKVDEGTRVDNVVVTRDIYDLEFVVKVKNDFLGVGGAALFNFKGPMGQVGPKDHWKAKKERKHLDQSVSKPG